MATEDSTCMTDGSYEDLRAEAVSVNDRLSRNMEGICPCHRFGPQHQWDQGWSRTSSLWKTMWCKENHRETSRWDWEPTQADQGIMYPSWNRCCDTMTWITVGCWMNFVLSDKWCMQSISCQPSRILLQLRLTHPTINFPLGRDSRGSLSLTHPPSRITLRMLTKMANWQHKESIPSDDTMQDFMPSGNSLPVPKPPWGQANTPYIPPASGSVAVQQNHHMGRTHPNMPHPSSDAGYVHME